MGLNCFKNVKQICKCVVLSSYTGIAKDSDVLAYEAVSRGNLIPTFRRNVLPSFSEKSEYDYPVKQQHVPGQRISQIRKRRLVHFNNCGPPPAVLLIMRKPKAL